MKRWEVKTRATVIRYYYVDADDDKSAEAASCDTTSDHEDDRDEETISITEIVDHDRGARTNSRGPFFLTQWEREDYEREQRGEKPLGPVSSQDRN